MHTSSTVSTLFDMADRQKYFENRIAVFGRVELQSNVLVSDSGVPFEATPAKAIFAAVCRDGTLRLRLDMGTAGLKYGNTSPGSGWTVSILDEHAHVLCVTSSANIVTKPVQ